LVHNVVSDDAKAMRSVSTVTGFNSGHDVPFQIQGAAPLV
jgi:hypothetical protein